jgi:hypothetical protein
MKIHSGLVVLGVFAFVANANATRLLSVDVLDDEHVMLRFADSVVKTTEGPNVGTGFMQGHESRALEEIVTYGRPINLNNALALTSYSATCRDDPNYMLPQMPVAIYRKTKVSGTAWKWPDPDLTYEHTFFLKFPKKFAQGKSYKLLVGTGTNTDVAVTGFTFDWTKNQSEAVHVNLVGAHPDMPMKSADLYAWMGDGGFRDYTSYVGRKVYAINQTTGAMTEVNKVQFWRKSAKEYGGWNLTASDVWTCDYSALKQEGKFRIAVEGVGCSPEIQVSKKALFEPFRTSVRGFYYMRIGEPLGLTPPPRQPRLIPDQDPKGFKVYLTEMSPWHPDWKTLPGDGWDVVDWSKWKLPGSPTNPNAYGGHSDALDWDRHLGHVPIIWDLLLPYLLTNGKGGEDNLGIRESRNGIPDVIDEAENEADFWYRLRDQKGGFATGLNNPDGKHQLLYQGAAKPYMAWANAANCAILANAYMVAKKPEMVSKWVKRAKEAWKIANGEDLDVSFYVGNGRARGRDHKLLAAACLFNVTGDKTYEKDIAEETVLKNGNTEIEKPDVYNQQWGTAMYLLSAKHKWQSPSNRELLKRMESAMINEAISKNVQHSENYPSRRAADPQWGWFQTISETQKVCIAHAITSNKSLKERLLRAMLLEADYTLGRNPMNMTQMTGIGSRRPEYIYTSGKNDGVPESHPGHTPYMNSEPWGENFMANPRYYASRGYPEWEKWPQGEALWKAPHCYSNNEFTPQQSMKGKHVLYGYLYSL